MRVGDVFPQTEIGADVADVRGYAEQVEAFGYRHVLAYDHVVGADPAVHHGWRGPYDVSTTFHEPLVLFGYLAAATSLELTTGIIILPQRQTVLVAKQAAEVDLLSGGRLRFGVGLGWNKVEYEALGVPFAGRGRRLEEQVGLLRRLWTEPSVTHDGRARSGAGRRPGAAARPAAHSHLDRRQLAPGLSPGGAAGRRMVPDGLPRTRARQRSGTGRRGCPPRRVVIRPPSGWRVG